MDKADKRTFGEDYMKYLILIVVFIAGCNGAYYHTEDNYRQNRVHEQILQHGAGGCTPNMSTGGCL